MTLIIIDNLIVIFDFFALIVTNLQQCELV